MRRAAIVCWLVAAGCGSGAPPDPPTGPIGGGDFAGLDDAGFPIDASPADGLPLTDGPTIPDGAITDAGAPFLDALFDASLPTDAAFPDAAAPDAALPGVDGGFGACMPATPQLYVTGGFGALGVAVDATVVYFSARPDAKALASDVFVAPIAGGMSHQLHLKQDTFAHLLVDASHIYTFGVLGTLQRANLDGSGEITLDQGHPARYFAQDPSRLYWTSGSSVLATVKGGGPLQFLVANTTTPLGVAVDASFVYYASGDSLFAVPRLGGAPEVVVPSAGTPTAVAVDATQLYWGDATGTVWAAGKTPTQIGRVLLQCGTTIDQLVVDGPRLFTMCHRLVNAVPADYAIIESDLDGGSVKALDQHEQVLHDLTTDAKFVYATGVAGGVLRVCK